MTAAGITIQKKYFLLLVKLHQVVVNLLFARQLESAMMFGIIMILSEV
jgi:hypothetical protein